LKLKLEMANFNKADIGFATEAAHTLEDIL